MIGDRNVMFGIFAAMIFSILLLGLGGCALKIPVADYGSITIGYEPNDQMFQRYNIDYNPATLRDK